MIKRIQASEAGYNDEYEFVGKMHNEAMDVAYNELKQFENLTKDEAINIAFSKMNEFFENKEIYFSATELKIFKENALRIAQFEETATISRSGNSLLDSIVQSLEIPENQLPYVNDIIDLANSDLSTSDLRTSLDILNEEAYSEFGENVSIEILSISSILINSSEYWEENGSNWNALDGSSPKTTATMDHYWEDLAKMDLTGALVGAYYQKTWQGALIGGALASLSFGISRMGP